MSRGSSLRVFDPLYGELRLPSYLEPFLLSPEFNRLGGVRLLNCESLDLAALSEARRRSHTLGVLHLATRLTLLQFGPEDVKALLFAIVLHDVGTPPFGHSMEYEFIRLLEIDHEQFVGRILDADHHTHAHAHQLAGRQVSLHRLIKNTGVEERIREILAGRHPLSTILAGDLDLDNLDNVYRMAWYLGIHAVPSDAERLSSLIQVGAGSEKLLAIRDRHLVDEWARLRALAYRKLFHSDRHRRAQGVLSKIMTCAMAGVDGGRPIIEQDDWLMTDEELIGRLRRERRLDALFQDLDRPTPLPETALEFETDHRLDRPALMRHRDALALMLAELDDRIYVVLIPYGEATERRVSFIDPDSGERWTVGSPRRIYRLHVHLGGAMGRNRVVRLSRSVMGKLDDYAEREGWRIGSRLEAAAA